METPGPIIQGAVAERQFPQIMQLRCVKYGQKFRKTKDKSALFLIPKYSSSTLGPWLALAHLLLWDHVLQGNDQIIKTIQSFRTSKKQGVRDVPGYEKRG